MRVLMVLCALVAAPFVAGVSQGGHDAQQCGYDWHAQHQTHANSGKHLGWAKQVVPCPPPAPQPVDPPPVQPPAVQPPPVQPPAGTNSVDGRVYNVNTFAPYVGWSVELTGTVNMTVQTDANGNYAFNGLPDGAYTVCQGLGPSGVQPAQKAPTAGATCPFGFGYGPFPLSGGQGASFNNFGNSAP